MDVNTVARLYSIFSDKKWTEKDGDKVVFTNFCNLLLNLDDSKRSLIIDLTERYTWITLSEYQSRLIHILNSIETQKIDGLKRIILFPIMRPEDESKTKSGHTILYMVRAFKPLLDKYKNIEFEYIESFAGLAADKFKIKENDAIFLLDDFLGSGETIKATLTEVYRNNKDIEAKHLNVVSLVSQAESIDFLESVNVPYYIGLAINRGISDYYIAPELEQKIQLMEEIEKLIPVNHFSFGYNQSEALVTLMRTPDNTFPIFWKEHKIGSQKFDAPFSRY